jgi:hypothetical protein
MEEAREYVADPDGSTDSPFLKATRVKPFTGTKDKVEPITWNPFTGDMPTKDIACGNPYLQFGAGGNLLGYIYTGISVNLWYQKIISKFEEKFTKHPPENKYSGVTITVKGTLDQTVSSYLVPETKTHIIDLNPGSGLFFYLDSGGGPEYRWTSILQKAGQPDYQQGGTPPNYWMSYQTKCGIFAITYHPLVWTRELTFQTEDYTYTQRRKKIAVDNPQQISPPPYSIVLDDIAVSYAYSKEKLKMGVNQVAVTALDKDGKSIIDDPKNQLISMNLTDYYSYSELTDTHKRKSISGYTEWSDD